jgi:hypothetical protein
MVKVPKRCQIRVPYASVSERLDLMPERRLERQLAPSLPQRLSVQRAVRPQLVVVYLLVVEPLLQVRAHKVDRRPELFKVGLP